MAAGTIAYNLFHLTGNWPKAPDRCDVPLSGFTGLAHHNVETAAYVPGTQITVYNDGSGGTTGYSTFIYLQLYTQAATLAAKLLCGQISATLWYRVSNNGAATIEAASPGCIGVALSAMTSTYYGWFWCDGVCPVQYVAALTGNYVTKDVVAGPMAAVVETAVINFTVATTLKGHVGYSLVTDT